MAQHKDRGFRGTKFIMAIVSMVICIAGFGSTAVWPALGTQYTTLVGAINGIACLYMGGNAASQWVAAKHGPKEVPTDDQAK